LIKNELFKIEYKDSAEKNVELKIVTTTGNTYSTSMQLKSTPIDCCNSLSEPDPALWATFNPDGSRPWQIQADIPYHGIDGSNGYAKANSSCDSHLASLNVLIL
jgi:hypothetical protein